MFMKGDPELKQFPGYERTRDHAEPKAHGHSAIVFSCRRCNNAKGDAPYALFVAFLETRPFLDEQTLGSKFRRWVYARALSTVQKDT